MRLLIPALLAALPGVATAQTSMQDDIVVRDRRVPEKKAIESYVANISGRSDSQLPRFHQPVCPAIIGLDRPYAAIVEQRIRSVAAAAGAAVSKKAKCSANLIVILAENGGDLVKDIRAKRAGWFGELYPSEINALTKPAPARAWNVASIRNEDGEGLRRSGDATPPVLRVMSASIIKEPTRQDMEASFVVIDSASTFGMTLRQIADYAAMRGLARTRAPKAGGSIDTILTVFDPSVAPTPELTPTDLAYLRALYASDGRYAAVTERNAITRRIARGK
jgi:hypothetical protein